MTCGFDTQPSQFIAVERAHAELGLANIEFTRLMLSDRFLRSELDERFRALLEPLPSGVTDHFADFCCQVTMSSPEERTRVTKIMTVLINRRSILSSTDAQLLRDVANWCGIEDMASLVRFAGLPSFDRIAVLSVASLKAFDEYAQTMLSYLLGILPSAYLQRLNYRPSAECLPKPAYLSEEDGDRRKVVDYALEAFRRVIGEGSSNAVY
ncbi:hypothetical protein [Ensifer sp. SL37]|uniref:hypothetical protein n=1 Tax=Ensifer sp. SL37 TaxID=2995137 RepID=UPI0022765403|nr:hypothetical protein [Ensifer sp. SL37]MCY1740497.1 hypothetical protein [Ensifer sp. SL37]